MEILLRKILFICILSVLYTNTFSQKTSGLYDNSVEYEKQAVYLPIRTKNIKNLISSGYGYRNHPIIKKRLLHNGIDIRAHYEAVFSVALGLVKKVGYDNRSGNFIVIEHLNGFTTSYCHLSSIFVEKNQIVIAGYNIGISGNTGNSTGPHLHFSLKVNGNSIDPLEFILSIEAKNKKS